MPIRLIRNLSGASLVSSAGGPNLPTEGRGHSDSFVQASTVHREIYDVNLVIPINLFAVFL